MSHISCLLYTILLLPCLLEVSDADQQFGLSTLPNFEVFQSQTNRANFVNESDYSKTNVLLQEEGSVDTIQTFFLKIPNDLLAEDIAFSQTSSNEKVLNISASDNIIMAQSSTSTLNITCTLSFDSMVGRTDYTLVALKKSTNEVVGSISIPFVIVGMTFFVESAPGNITIVSGDANGYFISYQEALKSALTESKKIRVMIQYPNGTSSADMTEQESILYGNTMQSSVSGYSGQFDHKATQCDTSQLGSLSQSRELQLPPFCGYGFYRDLQGHLCFGIDFNPYRAGSFNIQYSWTGITATDSRLSGDIFEFSQHIFITGQPPVTVMAISPPEKVWRSEGGEVISVEVFNADLFNVSRFIFAVESVDSPFNMVYGSYSAKGAPHYSQEFSFLTEAGSGIKLNWTLQYFVNTSSQISSPIQTLAAAIVPGLEYFFNYDAQELSIDSLTPPFGRDEGGTEVLLTGYFPFFNVDVDGVHFSGNKLSRKYVQSASNGTISILSPPKSELGDSYEYVVALHMGNAVSNSKLFSFVLKDAQVRISQSGTSEIQDEVYSIGDCTVVTFTAVVTPFTNQIQTYNWSLHRHSDSEFNLLDTNVFTATNASAQTIELDPEFIAVGAYSLKVVVALQGQELIREIMLQREHKISIGAFILDPPERTIAYPDAPLRLSAIVRPPGDCYEGNQTMMFEWTAFNETKTFSSLNATGSVITKHFSTTPTRLGWEYIVPRETLSHGNHTIGFKVWMAESDSVSGQAESYVIINESPLVAVIRYGEQQVSANYFSTLSLFGTESYDPDVLTGDRRVDLSFKWSCRQSGSRNFSASDSSACLPALLPDTSGMLFSAPISVLEALSEVQFLQYSLVVSKGIRVSKETTLVVEIQNRGTKPFLDDYKIRLTTTDGTFRDWGDVAHYERTIISVEAASEVSWTYALLQPSVPNFFSFATLINSPLFFSADANVFTVSGNRKPLGIEAGKLDPFTTYQIKILFDGGEQHEATSVVVSLRTAEAPVIGFPSPSVMSGTTNTTFTVTAGIPRRRSVFSYYFILTDEVGNSFCVGGCTGYEIAYFSIGRPGEYSLSAYIFDMQGKALLDAKTQSENITVSDSGQEMEYLSTLDTLFDTGDDITWTQLAHDWSLILLDNEPTPNNVRMLTGLANHEDATSEDLLAARMESALNISIGCRKIFCSSYPNSYHGRDCMSLATDLSEQPFLDTETVINLMVTVECCVQNTPLRTINKMGSMFPELLDNLNRLSKTIDQGGVSRRRLLQNVGERSNVVADVNAWTSRQLSAAVTSGQLDGFTANYSIGRSNDYGHISVSVASNPGHLPKQLVNGIQRSVVAGPSENELFYARDSCLSKVFSASGDQKRYFVLHTMDNFLLDGFQDPPKGTNLADNLYWQRIYEKDVDGRFVEVEIAKEEACFCWRLPVLRKRNFLEQTVEYMAGMFSITKFKEFGKDVTEKGEAFSYVYEGIVTSEYNVTEGWVEACQDQVGLVSSTLVPRSANHAIGNGGATVLGTGGAVIVGLVIGALLFVVVAMASAWIFAARAMSDVAAPLAALSPHELYVERDVYGRGTIFDVNAVSLPSGD